jgi:hypothetical protein
MAATKRSGKKGGGAAKKGGAKKGAAKKGGAKRGGTRGFGSVLSNIGSIAGTVGSIAGAAGGIAGVGGGRKAELRVAAPRDAGIGQIVSELRKKFREAGCPNCRSGIDRIILEDIVAGGGRR